MEKTVVLNEYQIELITQALNTSRFQMIKVFRQSLDSGMPKCADQALKARADMDNIIEVLK